MSRALDGNTNPFGSHGEEVTPEDFRPLFLSRQEALAQQSPHEILACFAASGNALIGLYQGLSPADMDRPALHPIGMRTIGTFVAYRAYELAFHGWDIRASVDPQATIRAELAVSLVGLVRQFQSRFCRPVPDLEGACRLEVDGHAWTVVMRNGTLAEAPADADVSIKTDPSAYLLLATARRTLADLAGHVVIDGDLRLAERLLGAVCFRV